MPVDIGAMPETRLSIRTSLALGLLVTLALWTYTGVTFFRHLDAVERDAATVASRYLRAQELLSTVRTQVLVASVRVRDALIDPDPAALPGYHAQVRAAYAVLDDALAAYEPVLGSDPELGAVTQLRREVESFRATVFEVLRRLPGSPGEVRELLATVVPRREAAVRVSEETQALNRAAFLQQQVDFAEIHRAAARTTLLRLAASAASTLLVLGVSWGYAGRLERRLVAQVDRGTRLSHELQGATVRLMEAQEEQRRTIARELHDEVGQALTAVRVELSVAQREAAAAGVAAPALAEAERIVAGTIGTVRDLTQLLHPSALDDLGLAAAADVLLRGLGRRHEMDVRLDSQGLEARIDAETERAAYRIVQEALTNVARHADASRCEVALRRTNGGLVVDVKDNGKGFELAAGFPKHPGVGLIGIRERVAQLCGTWSLVSEPGAGTHLHVELPLDPPSSHSLLMARG
jgi:signal transduction histidine kinase